MAKNTKQRPVLLVLKNTLNRVTIRFAQAGLGPFSLIRHVGRKSGRTYETPVILARVPEGFVAELTYGDQVDWYRNVVAAGGCDVRYRGNDYHIDQIGPYDADRGRAAYGFPQRLLLKALSRDEFRLLRIGDPANGER